MTRREFISWPIAAAACSAVAGTASAANSNGTPGLFPGRVVGIRHSGANGPGFTYQEAPVQLMIRSGIAELTGQASHAAAWRQLFGPGDVVGIKVNGNASPAMITSPAALIEVVKGLLLAGVLPGDIVVFERYQDGLAKVLAPGTWLPAGVRTAWSTPKYLSDQTGISGYDPNHYVDFPGYLLSWQNPAEPSHTRSYVSVPISRVTKLISLTTLKAHNASGVTLGLKNCTIGGYNNCNRFHDNGNYLDQAIPALAAAPVVRNKMTLSIIEGVHCLIAGGPNPCSWPSSANPYLIVHNTTYFSTDFVAGDRVGWRTINEERAKLGMQPTEIDGTDPCMASSTHRLPQHITVAGQQYGLGEWRDENIDFRLVALA